MHFTSSDAQASLPADYAFAIGDQGTHSFSVTLKTAGSHSITASDTVTGSITGTQAGITVIPAAASILAVSEFPVVTNAGQIHTLSVTAKDAYNNIAKGYTGTVHFTSSDLQAVLPADYAFTIGDQGTRTFSITLRTTGSHSITATDTVTGSITGTQAGITVKPAVTALVLSAFPATTTAGQIHTLTVTARDALGDTAIGYSGTVHFSSSDLQAALPADYTFTVGDAGVKTFSIALKTAGSQSITATDVVTGSITGMKGGITVSPATASKLVVSGFPPTTTAGQAKILTVTAQDAYGNTATAYTGTIHFTSSDPQAIFPADPTFSPGDAGVKTFSITLKTAGIQSVTATDVVVGSITGTQAGITVSAAAVSKLVLSGFPSTVNAGDTHSLTVTATDAYGNRTTGYTGTVKFISSDAQAILPANYTFTGGDQGVHTFSVTLRTTGIHWITVADVDDDDDIEGTLSGIRVIRRRP